MSRVTDKFTYTDGSYFCNVCSSPHEGEELASDCYEACLDEAKLAKRREGREHVKVALLHENHSWEEVIFVVPSGEGDPFDRVRQKWEGTVLYRKIVTFVDFGEPDDYDLENMEIVE